MSWFTAIWKKESTKVIFGAALNILKVVIGKSAEEVWKRTTESVMRAEDMANLTGPEKAKYVLNDMISQWGDIRGYIRNLILELAVAYVKEGLIKR